VLLVNSKSRSGAELFGRAQTELGAAKGVELVKAFQFRSVDRLIAACQSAVTEKMPLVIIGGGDGTINACAGILAHSQTTMGVLPLGTGNAFAHDLEIPIDVTQACEVIRTGREVEVDLGKIEKRYFVNVATVGLTTEIAKQLTDGLKKRLGRLAYGIAIVRAIKRLEPFHARLETENGVTEFECLQVVIGNGRYHGGPFPVLPGASLQKGKFGIYALTGCRRSELIKFALFLPGGNHAKLDEVHVEYACGGTLTTTPIRKVTVDGEIALQTPVHFDALPGALKVLVPTPSEE